MFLVLALCTGFAPFLPRQVILTLLPINKCSGRCRASSHDLGYLFMGQSASALDTAVT